MNRALVVIGWVAIGVLAAGWIARVNRKRGVRRVPALEHGLGWLYLGGAVGGPLVLVAGFLLLAALKYSDAADERRVIEERARRLVARREARGSEDIEA